MQDMQCSLVPNTRAIHMSVKITSVPNHVGLPTWQVCSLTSSIKDVAETLKQGQKTENVVIMFKFRNAQQSVVLSLTTQ